LVSASLLLGAAWALWHAPLFVIAGYYGTGAPPAPVLFVVAILVHSVLYTWIYYHTERSVLVVIAFHFMINFVGMRSRGLGGMAPCGSRRARSSRGGRVLGGALPQRMRNRRP
jgi:membrane protease YdiL (CAAX protease family)